MITSVWELGRILAILFCSATCIGYIFAEFLIKKYDLKESWYMMLLTGLGFFYTLLLLQLPLNFIVFYFKIISLAGLFYLFYSVFKKKAPFKKEIRFLAISIIFIVTSGFLLKNFIKVIIYEPIIHWDARSIWYFRAKQLLFNNGFSENLGICSFNCPTSFSHAQYSFLVPALGSFISLEAGFWNEFVPKANLLILLAGVITGFLMLGKVNVFFRLVLFYFFFTVNPALVLTGYIDSWLGIYTALTLLFLSEYLRSYKKEYLYSFVTSLLFLSYLKNEGLVLSVCILSSAGFFCFLFMKRRFLTYTLSRLFQIKYLIGLNLLPLILWTVHKKRLNYVSIDYNVDLLADKNVWLSFFTSEKFRMIFESFIQQSNYTTVFVACIFTGLICIWVVVLSMMPVRELRTVIPVICIPLVSSLLFFLAMCAVYYTSVIDLGWHLLTSADRLRDHLFYMSLISLFYSVYYLFFRRKRVVY